MVFRSDIRLTESLGAELDDRGDLTDVTERGEALQQRAVLRTFNVTFDERGSTITPATVQDLRDRVERALSDDEVIDVSVTVYVDKVTTDSVSLLVELGEQRRFTLNVP